MNILSLVLISSAVMTVAHNNSTAPCLLTNEQSPVSSQAANLGQQISCLLTIEQSPELRGFRLGMTVAQISQRYPRLFIFPANDIGEQRAIFDPSIATIGSEDSTDFTNVRTIELAFLDSQLTSVKVTYDGSVRFQNQRDFLSRVATGLNLPNNWELMARQGQGILCRGFNVVADYNEGIIPQVTLFNTSTPETIHRRRLELEERRRQTFRP